MRVLERPIGIAGSLLASRAGIQCAFLDYDSLTEGDRAAATSRLVPGGFLAPQTRTLGVDLSTDPRRTGLCLLEWLGDGRPAQVDDLVVGATDETVVRVADGADHIGIDAPFGWPKSWSRAVAAHRPGDPFAADGSPAELTRRYTDEWIAANVGIRPLAVAANLIGATAIRCARLVAALRRPVDTGEEVPPGSVSEVYPAAALKRWGQEFTLYKGRQWREARLALVAALIEAGLPVALTSAQRAALEANDDALDALIASLVARAVVLGLTDDCPPEARESCRSEGWIRVPAAGTSLRDLVEPRPGRRPDSTTQ